MKQIPLGLAVLLATTLIAIFPATATANTDQQPVMVLLGSTTPADNQLIWVGGDDAIPTGVKCPRGTIPAVIGTAGRTNRLYQDEVLDPSRAAAVAPVGWDGSWAYAVRTSIAGQGAAVWCVEFGQVGTTWSDLDYFGMNLRKDFDERNEFGLGLKTGLFPVHPFAEFRLTADLYSGRVRFENIGLHLELAGGVANTTQVRPTGSYVLGLALRPNQSWRTSVGVTSREVMKRYGESTYTRMGVAGNLYYWFDGGAYLGVQLVVANGATDALTAIQGEGAILFGFSPR